MKKTKMIILITLLITVLTGCNVNTTMPADPEETEMSEFEKSDAYYDYYDFTSEVYQHYKTLGYDDNFIIALTSWMLYESGGDTTAMEFSRECRDNYNEFLRNSDTSDTSVLLESYHNYGDKITEKTGFMYESCKNSEGELCPGIGLLMWSSNRGDQMLQYCNQNWKTREAQFGFIDYEIENHYDALKPENFTAETPEEAIQTINRIYINAPDDKSDIICDYIKPVQEIIDSLR